MAVVIIDVTVRTLHFLDLQEDRTRRFRVMAVMDRFLLQTTSPFRSMKMRYKAIRSHQQVNGHDCDLYTFENARTVIKRRGRLEIIGNAPKIDAFNRLCDTVMQNWL